MVDIRVNTLGDDFVRVLSSIYRSGTRIYDPDFALAQDRDFYEKAKRDPITQHALMMRKHRVAGRNWTIEPGGPTDTDAQAARLCEEAIRPNLRKFAQSRFNLAEAILRGMAVAYIEGVKVFRSTGDGKLRKWWVPTRLVDVDKRRFRFVPVRERDEDGNETLHVRRDFWSVARARWEILNNPEWFVFHVYDDSEERLGFGRPLAEALYHHQYAKTIVLREGLQGLKRWAQGMLVGKVDGLREGSTDGTNAKVAEEWLKVLEKMQGRNVAVFDKNDELETMAGPAGGTDMVTRFLEYLDNAVVRLILGAVLPTGGGDASGSLARAAIEEESTENLLTYDRETLSESISAGVIRLWWKLNKANIAEIGLRAAKMPRFAIVNESRPDPIKAAQVIQTALTSGVKLKADEVYERLGYTKPDEGDEVIEGPEQAPPIGGLPFNQGVE